MLTKGVYLAVLVAFLLVELFRFRFGNNACTSGWRRLRVFHALHLQHVTRMCSRHRHINTITIVLQCSTRIIRRSLWSQFTFNLQWHFFWLSIRELFGCVTCSTYQEIFYVTQYKKLSRAVTMEIRVSIASVKSKLSHHLDEMSLPQCGCVFQSVHGSFQQPQTVCSWIILACQSHQHPPSHGSVKESILKMSSAKTQVWPVSGY